MNWVLLRGLAREQGHWGEFPRILAHRFPRAVLACMDLPGAGTEHARPSPDSIEGMAADVRRRWLELRARQPDTQPWGVIAISMGGMVALNWCEKFPEDFSRAVIINSSAANVGRTFERIRPRALVTALNLFRQPDVEQRELGILRLTTCLRECELPGIARRWAELSRDRPFSVATAFTQIVAASRFNAPERLSLPLLVVSGRGDQFTSPACSERLAQKYHAPLSSHPRAGHDLPLDAPEWLASEIFGWCEAAPGARSVTRFPGAADTAEAARRG